jgi:hypothetical protein
MAPKGRIVMRQVVTLTATDRIDYWIRRRIVPCDALLPGNANPASDRYVGLHAIGKSLRDQYDALAVPVPPHLAALVKRLDGRRAKKILSPSRPRRPTRPKRPISPCAGRHREPLKQHAPSPAPHCPVITSPSCAMKHRCAWRCSRGTGTRRQFIPKVARLSSRAAFVGALATVLRRPRSS